MEPPLPIKITPWVWLSSQLMYLHYIQREENHGITHVLTMNRIENFRHLQSSFIDHSYIAADDEEGYDLWGLHWEITCRPLLKRVRCAAGQNRSGWVVAAGLLEWEGWSLLKTVR